MIGSGLKCNGKRDNIVLAGTLDAAAEELFRDVFYGFLK
jgi:hypothetical protein